MNGGRGTVCVNGGGRFVGYGIVNFGGCGRGRGKGGGNEKFINGVVISDLNILFADE